MKKMREDVRKKIISANTISSPTLLVFFLSHVHTMFVSDRAAPVSTSQRETALSG